MPNFANEGELCDAFEAMARSMGFEVYPEVDGYDLVLKRGDDYVGVEAKMRAGLDLLSQIVGRIKVAEIAAAVPRQPVEAPNYFVALAPRIGDAFKLVADQMRVHCVEAADIAAAQTMSQHAPKIFANYEFLRPRWRRPFDPVKLPEVAVQTGGGRPCPKQMSEWRHRALRLCILLDERGYLTSRDFDRADVSITRWVQAGWLIDSGERDGRFHKYVRGSNAPDVGYEAEKAAMVKG